MGRWTDGLKFMIQIASNSNNNKIVENFFQCIMQFNEKNYKGYPRDTI